MESSQQQALAATEDASGPKRAAESNETGVNLQPGHHNLPKKSIGSRLLRKRPSTAPISGNTLPVLPAAKKPQAVYALPKTPNDPPATGEFWSRTEETAPAFLSSSSGTNTDGTCHTKLRKQLINKFCLSFRLLSDGFFFCFPATFGPGRSTRY